MANYYTKYISRPIQNIHCSVEVFKGRGRPLLPPPAPLPWPMTNSVKELEDKIHDPNIKNITFLPLISDVTIIVIIFPKILTIITDSSLLPHSTKPSRESILNE